MTLAEAMTLFRRKTGIRVTAYTNDQGITCVRADNGSFDFTVKTFILMASTYA